MSQDWTNPSPELREKWKRDDARKELAWAKADLLVSIVVEAYKDGHYGANFEGACRTIDKLLEHLEKPSTWKREHDRAVRLGSAVKEMLSVVPARRKRGNSGHPDGIRKLAAKLVVLAREKEGLPMTNPADSEDEKTAFHWVSKELGACRYAVTAGIVHGWYYPRDRSTKGAGRTKRGREN